jgi:hypothetical protein
VCVFSKFEMCKTKAEEDGLVAQLQELEEIIRDKAEEVEKVQGVTGKQFNKRVRDAMYETKHNGDEYYGEQDEAASKEPNPFVRRKTIQHTMHFGEEAERKKQEETEKQRKVDEAEKAVLEEKERRGETIRASQLLSDIHSLKRKKSGLMEERTVLQGLEGTQRLIAQAHDFDLDLDI